MFKLGKILIPTVIMFSMSKAIATQRFNLNDLATGTFKGKTSSGQLCQVTLTKKAQQSIFFKAEILTFDRHGRTHISTMTFNKNEEIEINGEIDSDYKEVTLLKSKVVPDPSSEGDDEYTVTVIESVIQTFEANKLESIKFQWLEINEHSDPHDDSINCYIK